MFTRRRGERGEKNVAALRRGVKSFCVKTL